LHRGPLPDLPGSACLLVGQRSALRAEIAPPTGRDAKSRGLPRHAEGQTERRGEEGFRLRGAGVGRAVLRDAISAERQLVNLLRARPLPPGRQHADEVALADTIFVHLLFRPARGPEEVVQDSALELRAQLVGRWRLKQRWGRDWRVRVAVRGA